MSAIVEEVKKIHEEGRPILVGTITIEKSEEISKELSKAKIKHNVLNAKNHEKESLIIAQAGRLGQVTIATNMAGRGTDIMLGGNPEFLAKQKMSELGYTAEQIDFCTSYLTSDNKDLEKAREKYKKYLKEFEQVTEDEKNKVISLGGLHIIGTERHESRRIDNQLRGRAGRQGDPGSSVFYVSMEDELMRRFGAGEKLQGVVKFFKLSDDTSFSLGFLAKQIEAAQRRIEGFNFSARHTVLKFDDVKNQQRKEIYNERNRVIDGADVHEEVLDMIKDFATNSVYDGIDDNSNWENWNVDKINSTLNNRVLPADFNFVTADMIEGLEPEELAQKVSEKTKEIYESKCKALAELNINHQRIEREILLRVVDSLWRDHIDYMEILRGEIGLRAYGNHDPIVAFKEEASNAYEKMIDRMREETAMFLLNFKVQIERKVPVNVTQKKLTQEDMEKIKKIAEAKMKEQKEKGNEKSVQEDLKNKNIKTDENLDKLMKAKTSIDMVTNKTEKTQAKTQGKLVGRNDPCPCGSGKKYKQCCGK
jgi:preprotein translocase subunit SecA